MPPKILNKFTTHLKNALKKSENFCITLNHTTVNPEHLLYGLILQKGSIAAEILGKLNLTPEKIRSAVIQKNRVAVGQKEAKPRLATDTKKAIEKASLIAHQYKHKYIGTEHLLYSLINLANKNLIEIWEENKVNLNALKDELNKIMKSTSRFPDLTQIFEQAKEMEKEETGQPGKSKTPALDVFATDLTSDKMQKSIDPVIGRGREIERLIHILARRTKNNPVLIGDPGVGKTAIVEGLAKKILQGEVPDTLLNKKILRLDLSLVVAGTTYRGEFEARFKQILEEIKQDANIILFIDELHTIIGTGSAAGSMDAANILKPALSKGEIRVIGATTLDEYRKHIESDAALERRFQAIIIEEATPEETKEVLRGIKENYEKYHHVHITDEAIEAAVVLSSRYLQEKFLPDKAIDLVDEAASKIKVRQKSDGLAKEIRQTDQEIEKIRQKKHEAVNKEKFEEALNIKAHENALMERVAALKEKKSQQSKKFIGKITKKDIAEVVSQITQIPLQDLVVGEKERLINLEKLLAEKIIGQDEALKSIADFIRRSRVGLANPNRPIGSFIFLGPSGVGKTETAKVLAKTVFEDEHALIRIDMSEFAESFNISKLIGAPAGYVGYKEGSKLTEPVRRKPYSVVLFDEIEKAHPEVFNLLLQVLEDGHLTDAVGKKVNFKNTIVIMTSNVGLQNLNKGAIIGFEAKTPQDKKEASRKYNEIKEQVTKELEKKFRPEFLNRIDKIIVFKPLELDSIEKIVELEIKELTNKLASQNIKLIIDKQTVKHIAKISYKPEQGARAVRRTVQELIENPLAQGMLENKFKAGDTIKTKVHGQKIELMK